MSLDRQIDAVPTLNNIKSVTNPGPHPDLHEYLVWDRPGVGRLIIANLDYEKGHRTLEQILRELVGDLPMQELFQAMDNSPGSVRLVTFGTRIFAVNQMMVAEFDRGLGWWIVRAIQAFPRYPGYVSIELKNHLLKIQLNLQKDVGITAVVVGCFLRSQIVPVPNILWLVRSTDAVHGRDEVIGIAAHKGKLDITAHTQAKIYSYDFNNGNFQLLEHLPVGPITRRNSTDRVRPAGGLTMKTV